MTLVLCESTTLVLGGTCYQEFLEYLEFLISFMDGENINIWLNNSRSYQNYGWVNVLNLVILDEF